MLSRIFVFSIFIFEGNEAFVVESPSGLLSGWTGTSRNGRAYWAFTKIPYANPPVGSLRFKNPVPFGRWSGLYSATMDVEQCVQNDDRFQIDPYDVSGTEDCLYLNVYVPKINQKNLPVIVSILGGGFVTGNIGPKYVADYFMDENVVLVTMNYRVGPLGFMSMEDTIFPGNYGLKDQALALKWTKDNVKSFGGNPDLITVLGVSGGAASSHYMMLSPLTKDLVKGAVSISGTVNKVWSLKPPGLMRNRTRIAASFLGCEMNDSILIMACLQGIDAWRIYTTLHLFPQDTAFAPTVEPDGSGAFIPVDPLIYRSKTPWMVTFTNGERLLRYQSLESFGINYVLDIMTKRLNEYIGLTVDVNYNESNPDDLRVLRKIKARYLPPNSVEQFSYELAKLFEDVNYVYPAFDALERHAGPVYFARFECDVLDDGFNIANHASEASLLYKLSPVASDTLTRVSKQYLRQIVDFARYHNPTSNLSWTRWKANEMRRITCNGSFMADRKIYAEKENVQGFWKGIFCYRYQISSGQSCTFYRTVPLGIFLFNELVLLHNYEYTVHFYLTPPSPQRFTKQTVIVRLC